MEVSEFTFFVVGNVTYCQVFDASPLNASVVVFPSNKSPRLIVSLEVRKPAVILGLNTIAICSSPFGATSGPPGILVVNSISILGSGTIEIVFETVCNSLAPSTATISQVKVWFDVAIVSYNPAIEILLGVLLFTFALPKEIKEVD